MITAYLIASAILFTLCTAALIRKPHGEHDRFSLSVNAVFTTLGWVCVFMRLWP